MTGTVASRRVLKRAACAVLLGLLAVGAQMAQAQATPSAAQRKDPYESWNRSVYDFNERLDENVMKPVANAYRKVVPELVRTGIDNVLGNLGDVWSAANQLLQGKVTNAALMTLRVASNTTFGLGGLLDPATEMGLERQSEDFGQTLGRWGVPPGPYVVLPLLGPSTLRDTVATPFDRYFSPSYVGDTLAAAGGITMLQAVSVRAGLLSASQMLDDIALDKYSFLRDLYLARRQSQVYDGDPPEEPEADPEPADSAAAAEPAAAPASQAVHAEPAASR